jgi:hypothetical protein
MGELRKIAKAELPIGERLQQKRVFKLRSLWKLNSLINGTRTSYKSSRELIGYPILATTFLDRLLNYSHSLEVIVIDYIRRGDLNPRLPPLPFNQQKIAG